MLEPTSAQETHGTETVIHKVRVDDLTQHLSAVGLTGNPLTTHVLILDLDDDRNAISRDSLHDYLPGYPGIVLGITAGTSAALREVDDNFDILLCESPATGPDWVVVDDLEAAVASVVRAVRKAPLASRMLVELLRNLQGCQGRTQLAAESAAYSTLLGGQEFRDWLSTRATESPRADRSVDAPLIVRRRAETVELVLNRPAVRNAFNGAMRNALTDALLAVSCDSSVSSIVLTGTGPCFCSGGDLNEFGTAPDPVVAHMIRTRRGPAQLLMDLSHLVEVRIQGAAVGAGVELAAFAAAVVAEPGATFRLPEVEMGLIPGAGGTVSVPARIGRRRTAWLGITGATLSADEALAWGLIDSVVAPDVRWGGPSTSTSSTGRSTQLRHPASERG